MDTFDSYRSTVPARLPAPRPGAPGLRASSGLPEPASLSPLSIRTALRGARRYWWLVLMLWVVGSAGIGAAIYMKVKPSYKAYSLLRAEPSSNSIFGVDTNAEAFDMFLNTQVQLITSPNVLTAAGTNPKVAAIGRVRIAGDVVQELRKSVGVIIVPNTYLIEVSMTSPEPWETQVIVNAVVDAFLETNSEWSDGMNKNQIKNLEIYLRDLQTKTDDLERRWKVLVEKGDLDSRSLEDFKNQKTTKGDDGESNRSSITIEEFKGVRHDMLQTRYDLAEAEAWLATAKLAASKVGNDSSTGEDQVRLEKGIERRFRQDREVIEVATQMMTAKNKLEDMRRVINQGGDPAERLAKKKLEGLRARYDQLWKSKSRQFREEMEGGPSGEGGDREIREAQSRVDKLKVRQKTLQEQYDQLAFINSRQAIDQVEIHLILDERANFKSMQEQITRRLEQLKFESKGETRIRLVNPTGAMLPSRPIADKRYTYLAMTPLGVLGTVLGLIVLLEIRSGRVADPDVLSSRIKHEVFSIAPLPNIRPGEDATNEKAEQRLARFVQSLDHLRVAICEGGVAGEGRCVMITSATGGEGKTTLSAHLAARCANSGTSTLLIDADMRRASLGRLLDVPVGPGLGDVLGGEIDLDEALITVQAGGFHFLSAGTPGRDPSRVLKSARLSELISRLRRTYDLVIIDTPPVLPVADALIMGRWADGAVMAARFDASRLPLVERANRQLALAGIPVLGVVVNGVRGQDATYGNYAYSYNYYPGRPDRSGRLPSA
jgi:polysaccharide biosynthesis transport protein